MYNFSIEIIFRQLLIDIWRYFSGHTANHPLVKEQRWVGRCIFPFAIPKQVILSFSFTSNFLTYTYPVSLYLPLQVPLLFVYLCTHLSMSLQASFCTNNNESTLQFIPFQFLFLRTRVIHICMYLCIRLYIYIHMCILMCIYIYIYIYQTHVFVVRRMRCIYEHVSFLM